MAKKKATKEKTKSKYYFDEKAANKAVQFVERFGHHVKGELAGELLKLEPWQKELVRNIFGWLNRKTGARKYRTVYVEIPRKNGKTTLAAIIALYMLLSDGENGAEVYSAAADKEQANIAFEIASEMVRKEPEMEKRVTVMRRALSVPGSASTFKSLTKESKTKHGLNASCVIVDELHAHPSRDLYDVLTTSTGSRKQPLTFIITTAGTKQEGMIGWEMHRYAEQIRDGIHKDETFYQVIFAADPDANPFLVKTWKSCNPTYPISPTKEYMYEQVTKCKIQPSYLNVFKRLHLNTWTSSEIAFIQSNIWEACNTAPITPELFKGRACVGGLDLSSTRDFTSLVLCFDDPADPELYHLMPFFWIPKDTIRDRKMRDAIMKWHKAGHIYFTPGNVVDYRFIEHKVMELNKLFDIREIAFDNWNASQVSQNLINEGFEMVEFRQGFGSMSAPTKELEKKAHQKKINHGGNPVLAWQNDNVMIKMDPAGNIKMDKNKSEDKIDGMISSVMALSRALFGDLLTADQGSVYDKRGVRSL